MGITGKQVLGEQLIEAVLADPQRYWAGFAQQYGGLVVSALSKFNLTDQERQDLQQVVWLHLIKNDFHVLRNWRKEQGAKLSTYLSVVIRYRIQSELRKRQFSQRTAGEVTQYELDEDEEGDFWAVIPSPDQGPDELVQEGELTSAIQTILHAGMDEGLLTPAMVMAWQLKLRGLSAKEVGQIVGKAGAWVNKAAFDVRMYLRDRLKKFGWGKN